ncbi:MAG: site-2 protease family protein [Chloroflexi bacterium]|nr:site-2 protease family protein [Chloroflexota bacterium]
MLSQILEGQFSAEALVGLAIALILGISVHEFSHALAATWLGDSLPRRQGRLTLAPLAHLDVMGSLMFVIGGFGWGKPVQYNPYALRAGPRTGPALVAVAGPIANFVLATLVAIPTRLLVLWVQSGSIFATQPPQAAIILLNLLWSVIYYNLMLSLFNLIPVFPLDGFSVLLGLLPPSMADQYEQTKQWGILVLFVLIFLGGRILDPILYAPVATLAHLLTGV